MKKTLRRLNLALAVVIVMLIGLFTYSGCQTYLNEQGVEVTTLTPETTEVLDKAVEVAPVAVNTLTGVAVAFPSAAVFLGTLAGAIAAFTGAYKKYRPQLTAEQDKSKIYYNTTQAIVYAIEHFKANKSDDWADLKIYLKEELGDKVGPEGMAIIEALVYSYGVNNGVYADND